MVQHEALQGLREQRRQQNLRVSEHSGHRQSFEGKWGSVNIRIEQTEMLLSHYSQCTIL
jgi:hypothetical protein